MFAGIDWQVGSVRQRRGPPGGRGPTRPPPPPEPRPTHPPPARAQAYANNQWALGDALTEDPGQTSFHKAMALADGTVSVLDKGGVVFTRIWCGYEVYVSLVDAKPGYTWGVYTLRDGAGAGAVGLTDGFAPADYDSPPSKQQREARFPFALAQQALAIELQSAQASVASDKTHILNAMIGETDDFNAPLPERHERYDLLNETLRARFAAGSLRAALERDEAAPFFEALAKGRMHELSLDFERCASFAGGAVDRLVECLPATLQKLAVRSDPGDHLAGAFAPWLRVNSVLTSLNLKGNYIGDDGAKAIGGALRVNGVLTDLDLADNQLCGLDRRGRGVYTAEGINAIAEALRVNSVLTSLNLATNNLIGETSYYIKASTVQGKSFNVGDKVTYQGREMIVSRGKDSDGDIKMKPLEWSSGIAAIADALRVNSVLTSLNLEWNLGIGDAGKAALREIAKDRPSLTLKL